MTPQELRNSILQLAIQGRLVEQRPEEGTAEELYRQIQAEKQALIKAGKIKKEKPLPEIGAEEIPFDIPESWKWVRLSDVIDVRDGTHDTPSYIPSGYPLITGKDFYTGNFELTNTKYISTADYLKICQRSKVDIDDILFSMIGGNIGSMIRITPQNWFEMAIKNVALFKQYSYKASITDFLSIFLKSQVHNMQTIAKGGAQSFVPLKTLRHYLFPLPPYSEQKRIAAKIEELLPLVDRYEKAYNRLNELNRRFPEDMRKSLLQLAIQGKLVEQRPEEGTAEELYRQIQAEKQALIKAGKIKKEKPLPEIGAEEIPFDIPESWKWVRLYSICESITDGDHQPPPQTSTGIPFLVISNLSKGHLDFSNTRFVSLDYYANLSNDRIPQKGNILFTVTGSYGITVKVDSDKQFCFQRHIALIKLLLDWSYVYYILQSPLVKTQCDAVATGTAQKTVGLTSLRKIIIPLPPMAEQKRIAAKLEELLPLCERLKQT